MPFNRIGCLRGSPRCSSSDDFLFVLQVYTALMDKLLVGSKYHDQEGARTASVTGILSGNPV